MFSEKIKPQFPINKIITGLYTRGGELMFEKNGVEYIGFYHKLPNDELWSGDLVDDPSSTLLVKLNPFLTENVKIYNKIVDTQRSNYINPVVYQPKPDDSDYESGLFYRYFVQRRNNPRNSIIEVDSEQVNKMNNKNKEGISSTIWNYVEIPWHLVGGLAPVLNAKAVAEAEINFKGILKYLTNYLEFTK